ncbi:MAG: hypothetical protein IPJ30_09230 [Acidobacteria bacterium]|nr:hypothetical protein [Acidobacteriota bacterium]
MNNQILGTYLRILAVVFVLSCLPTFAQTPQTIEKELVNHAKRIRTLATEEGQDNAVKLDAENDALKAKLVKYGRLASVLKYPFNELKKHLFVATSKDGKFRIYSWDTETGGTMHFYENVFQFQGGDGKVYAKAAVLDEGDSGGFYSDIFQVSTKNGTVYLGRMTATLSTKHSYEEVALFKIDRRTLDDRVRLFKTKAGLQDHIGFEYNFFSVVNRKERPIKLIQFDERSNTVRIPVVLIKKDDEIGTVTKRFINYRFNGTHFVNAK